MPARPDVEDYVSVPEGRIHYAKTGSGPPVAIFHGGGSSILSWYPVMARFGQHFTCYAFDMMSHGKSDDPPRENFSIPDYARTMHQAMEALGLQRLHLIGNLAGACLAMETAAMYPQRVDKLVLSHVPVVDPRITPQRVNAMANIWNEQGTAIRFTPAEMTEQQHFINPKQEWVDTLNDERAQGGQFSRIHSATNAWYDMVARLPLIKAAATLVIMGEEGGYRETEDIVIFNLQNASKVILPNSGHFHYIENEDGFVKAVLDFLK